MRRIYENKKTGQKVVTSEKLDGEHWEFVKEVRTMKKKDAKMKSKQVVKKTKK